MASDAAAWVQAAAEVGVLATGFAAALVAWRLHLTAKHDQEDRREHDKLRKAEKVAAWWAYRPSDNTYGLRLWNFTDSVIREFSAKAAISGHQAVLSMTILPPGELFAPKRFGPDKSRDFDFPEALVPGEEYRPVTKTPKFVLESISFVDDAKVRWERDEDGALTRSPETHSQ